MKRKGLLMGSILATMLLILASVSWAGGRIAHRQMRQLNRITDGVRKGEITGKELMRLKGEQRRIQRTIRRAKSDGRFGPRERSRIHTLQRRASERIYLAKHNRFRHDRRRPYYGNHPYRHRHEYRRYPYWWYRHKHHRRYHRHWYRPGWDFYSFRGKYYWPHYAFAFSMGWR